MADRAALIFKVLTRDEWAAFQGAGRFDGAPIDRSDGFIHLSSPSQVETTVEKHFAGQPDLVLVAVDPDRLGDGLTWEPSRGGDLFPHHYGVLDMAAVVWHAGLRADGAGGHVFPGGWQERER